ncbi:MAG: hypothetical protein KAU41_03815 [Deltaproteobacteria bacterium]|nr:hypothetical protein [Deltaproteobacteria bacterium]
MRTILFAITLLFLCSCSNVPKPASYPLSFQQKMQAVHHWDVLADDVAKDVKRTLQDRALLGEQIYLEPHEMSAFGEVFGTLLTTQLFKQEIGLAKNESNSLKLRYETQMVKHRSNRHTSPLYPGEALLLTALGHGIYKAFSANSDALGLFAAAGAVEVINGFEYDWTVPHHEIVITTELTNNDTVIDRRSNIYYINDADFLHYSEKEMPIKNYTCVSE